MREGGREGLSLSQGAEENKIGDRNILRMMYHLLAWSPWLLEHNAVLRALSPYSKRLKKACAGCGYPMAHTIIHVDILGNELLGAVRCGE